MYKTVHKHADKPAQVSNDVHKPSVVSLCI